MGTSALADPFPKICSKNFCDSGALVLCFRSGVSRTFGPLGTSLDFFCLFSPIWCCLLMRSFTRAFPGLLPVARGDVCSDLARFQPHETNLTLSTRCRSDVRLLQLISSCTDSPDREGSRGWRTRITQQGRIQGPGTRTILQGSIQGLEDQGHPLDTAKIRSREFQPPSPPPMGPGRKLSYFFVQNEERGLFLRPGSSSPWIHVWRTEGMIWSQ